MLVTTPVSPSTEEAIDVLALQKENREASKALRRDLNQLMDRRLAKLITKEEFEQERSNINAALEKCSVAHHELAAARFRGEVASLARLRQAR
jgi:hypothetical protein